MDHQSSIHESCVILGYIIVLLDFVSLSSRWATIVLEHDLEVWLSCSMSCFAILEEEGPLMGPTKEPYIDFLSPKHLVILLI